MITSSLFKMELEEVDHLLIVAWIENNETD